MQEFNYFKVDGDKKKEGVWIDHPSGKFLVGSPDPMDVTQALEREIRKIQKKHTTSKDPTGKKYQLKQSEQMMCNAIVIAELQLLGWEIEGVEYTKERAIDALISDREYTDYLESKEPELDEDGEEIKYQSLMSFVNEQSNNLSNYEKEEREENVKKSPASSSGEIKQS